MSLTLKLLGPDVPQGFSLTVDARLTVTQAPGEANPNPVANPNPALTPALC